MGWPPTWVGGVSRGRMLVREAGAEYEPDADAELAAELVTDAGAERSAELVTDAGAERSAGTVAATSAETSTDAETDLSTDTETLEALEHEITTLSAHVHAAEHRLLVLIAEFDRRGGWKPGGHPSCAEWLHFRTGIDRGAARERVRAAHALAGLPQVSEAMSKGELSFSKVRALSRLGDALDARAEAELVDFARQATAAELEKLVRGWKLLGRADEAELERRRHASRSFSVFPGDDGMYVVRGRLDPEVGALLMRAIEAAGDALHRPGGTWAAEGGRRGPLTTEVTPRQRRADAVGLLAERALAAGFGEEGEGEEEEGEGEEEEGEGEEEGARAADPLCREGRLDADGAAAHRESGGGSERQESQGDEGPGAEDRVVAARVVDNPDSGSLSRVRDRSAPRASRTPLSGSRAERYQVILHVDGASLAEGEGCGCGGHGRGGAQTGRQDGVPAPTRSHLEDGTRVSAETSRRLTCDAGVVRVSGAGISGGANGTRGKESSHANGGGGKPRSAGEDGTVVAGRTARLDPGGPGEPLHIGRRTRTIPPALRRALELRDGGCRFPGCGLRFTEAHHIVHWADGGETSLDNTVLVCRHHHRALHEEGFGVRRLADGQLRFSDRTGWPLPDCAPPSPTLSARPVEWLVARNRERGADPDGWSASSRYADIPWETEARVWDALDR